MATLNGSLVRLKLSVAHVALSWPFGSFSKGWGSTDPRDSQGLQRDYGCPS